MSAGNKIMVLLSGYPLIYHTINAFEKANTVDEIIIVTRKDFINDISEIINNYGFLKVKSVIGGGQARAESALIGFNSISPKSEYISIHDGARPLIKSFEIDKIHQECYLYKAVCYAMKVKDTIKKIDSDGNIISTLDRRFLISAATPQVFKRNIYETAIKKAGDKLITYTDDSGLAEDAGFTVKSVLCGYHNIKITTDEDLIYAETLLNINNKKQEDKYV
jgi:2-C-methyl-D-erythritol 4-phosphate cytidylyltransferase